jgi:hypothetical protein
MSQNWVIKRYQTLSQPKSVGTLEVNTITFGASIHCHEGAALPLAHCRPTFWSQSNVLITLLAFNNQISLGRTLIMTEVTSW